MPFASLCPLAASSFTRVCSAHLQLLVQVCLQLDVVLPESMQQTLHFMQLLLALAELLSQFVAPSGVDVSQGFRTAAMDTRPCTPAEGRWRASRRQHTQCDTLAALPVPQAAHDKPRADAC